MFRKHRNIFRRIPRGGEGGNCVRGQVGGEMFGFQSGAANFPHKTFAQFGVLPTSSLCTPSGGDSQVLLRCCRQPVRSSRPFISLAWE